MRQEVVFVQVSHEMTSPGNEIRNFYKRAYAQHEGFVMPEHFMEVPAWIAKVGGMLSDRHYHKSVYVVEDYLSATQFLWRLWYNNPEAILMMSMMDANKEVVQWVAKETGHIVIVGGYVDVDDVCRKSLQAYWLDSVLELGDSIVRSALLRES
jgi:hypothetical protein